jgi:uncharacterized membrane protein YqjE
LPDELTIRIVKEAGLPPIDLIKLQSASRQFRRVCRDNELWRELIVPRLPEPAGNAHQQKWEFPLYNDLCGMPKDAQAYLAKIWRSPNHTLTTKGASEAVRAFPQNRQIVYMAVQKDGPALQHAAANLQGDKVIVLAAVKQSGFALKHTATELQRDKEVVLAAVKRNGWALEYAAAELQRDKEVALAAVTLHGLALLYAATELKRDKEIVLAAVQQDSWALRYAAEELKRDKAFVLEVTKQAPDAFRHASLELRRDPEVLREVKEIWRAQPQI